MKTGDIVSAKVTNILGYGAFVKVGEYDGLVHISEFSDGFVHKITDYVNVGDEVRLRVIEVDDEHKQLKLSYKQLHKTRGVKCNVPTYEIGFKPLEETLGKWIKEYRRD
ncbi:MAG: S1 RNA-binding domain-containing protein [Bacilli bacterium]